MQFYLIFLNRMNLISVDFQHNRPRENILTMEKKQPSSSGCSPAVEHIGRCWLCIKTTPPTWRLEEEEEEEEEEEMTAFCTMSLQQHHLVRSPPGPGGEA